jgi:hypothetical protein
MCVYTNSNFISEVMTCTPKEATAVEAGSAGDLSSK